MGDWNDLIARPVKNIVSKFAILSLCRTPDCPGQGTCPFYHASIEEEGVESGLVDIWGIRWSSLDGIKQVPNKAAVLTMYLRVPESSFNCLHTSSGISAAFFEPRGSDAPGPDSKYAVVWLPQFSLKDVQHRVRTDDLCLAPCRIGTKYGVRCQSKHQEEVHKALLPSKPFVSCIINEVYRLEPLPIGTQRSSLVELLQTFGWQAKPLQACKGSMGKAWTVGAEAAPPNVFIDTRHGWVSITKVKGDNKTHKQEDIIATPKTRQHMKDCIASHSTASTDPWLSAPDPWASYDGFKSQTQAPAPTSHHVQSKMDDVEQRLQEHINATMNKQIKSGSDQQQQRLTVVESQIQTLVDNQSKLQHWITDGSQKMSILQQENAQLHQVVQHNQAQLEEQKAAIGQVAHEVGTCSTGLQRVTQEVAGLKDDIGSKLESYFAKQSNHIEALLEKKQRIV